MRDKKAFIVGCGLTGAAVARVLAEAGFSVRIVDRRKHIGGNMHDYRDEHGFTVHEYGPHVFHTSDEKLMEFLSRFEDWKEAPLVCGASWDGCYTPTPFNYRTIDQFWDKEDAARMKKKFDCIFGDQKQITVTEALHHEDEDVRRFAEYLFEKDYAPYTAKQWGMDPEEVDPSVLKRVPLCLSYEEGYFNDTYQVVPVHSYTAFFDNLLEHKNISVELGCDALSGEGTGSNKGLKLAGGQIFVDGAEADYPVVYTGEIDRLMEYRFGHLPYRSLRFEWKYEEKDSFQPYSIVAYPQAEGFTRITEYKKLLRQEGAGTSYALEYPVPSSREKEQEPYYPILTEDSSSRYARYLEAAKLYGNLFLCGRLGDFKYYNMDQALTRAFETARIIIDRYKNGK